VAILSVMNELKVYRTVTNFGTYFACVFKQISHVDDRNEYEQYRYSDDYHSDYYHNNDQ